MARGVVDRMRNRLQTLRTLPRRRCLVVILAAVVVALSVVAGTFIAATEEYISLLGNDDPEPPPQCFCRDLEQLSDDLRELRENVTAEDDAVALSPDAPLGSLERVVRRQREMILEQAQEIQSLREAARAQDLGISKQAVHSKEYQVFVVEEDNQTLWQQRKFKKHAAYGFIAFSAYRLSPSLVVVVGLGRTSLRGQRRVTSCHWNSESGQRIEGKLGLETMEEHHWFLYELLLLNCTYPAEHTSGLRGHKESSQFYTSDLGGYLEVQLDHEFFYPYRERNGYKLHKQDSDGPFPYEFVFCGPPMFGDFSIPSLTQWIAYHRFHAGFDHFFLYDSGSVTPDFRRVLDPLVADGLVTITDFREALQYDSWAQNQALGMHDCLFRSREIARWIAFHDLDEYLEAAPPLTVPGILKKYKEKPYITHGCMVYSLDNCEDKNVWDPQHNKFAVELMLFRFEDPYCTSGEYNRSYCLNYHGHRKMIQNPRKVQRTYVHVTEIPLEGGVDLPVEQLWHSHYRSLFNPSRACREEEQKGDKWKKVTSVAEIAKNARMCAKDNFMNEGKCLPQD